MSETTQTAPETKTRGVRLTQHGETTWMVLREEKDGKTTVSAYIVERRGGFWRLSKSDGKVYNVRLAGGDGPSCTCPDATYRRRICKHQSALSALLAAGRLS